MELEEAVQELQEQKEMLDRHIKNYEKNNCKTGVYLQLVKEKKAIETVLQALENSIPKKRIEDKIEKYKTMADDFYVKFLEGNRLNQDIRDAGFSCDRKIEVLQELLEEE